jgi:hypothetical protein
VTDYTAEEVDTAFENGDGWGEAKWSSKGEVTLRDETVAYENVANYGGEGQGDDIWVVVKIGDQLFRKDGYYASHYGSDWDGYCREVKAKEETVTVYEWI